MCWAAGQRGSEGAGPPRQQGAGSSFRGGSPDDAVTLGGVAATLGATVQPAAYS